MDLQVVNHFPTVNQTGVFLNETIKVYFNQAIDELSINWDNFSINDNYSYATVVGQIGPLWESGVNLSGVTSGLAFIPTINMLPNTEYSVYVFGKPNSVLGKTGSEIPTTYSYSFVTGTGYYDATGSVGVPSGVTSSSESIDLSGILDSTESSITTFEVYSTVPTNQKANISGVISEIKVIFTGNISTPSGDLTSKILLEEQDVL